MGESIYKHNPTLSANKHVVQICCSSLSAAADGLADSAGERRTSPVNGTERSLSRAVQQSQRLCPSPLHVPRFQLRCLCTSRRDACDRISALQAVLKGRTVAIRKKININLVYSSCLKHANNLPLGDQRQADQRTQGFHFAVVIHQSLDPAARSSAQAPSSLSSLSLHELRALTDRLRTRRRVGSTRRRGNHMHDHSRFQRDIDDVTGVSLSLSLSLPLTKVTHAQYRKRFRASYNRGRESETKRERIKGGERLERNLPQVTLGQHRSTSVTREFVKKKKSEIGPDDLLSGLLLL